MAFDLQNIIDSSIAQSGGTGNTANTSNSSLAAPATTTPEPSSVVVPVADVNQPAPVVPQMGERLPTSNVSQTLSGIQSRLETIQTERNTPSFADQALSAQTEDLSGQKQSLRDEAGLAAKEERARRMGERITERDNAYRDQIEALEKNPEGKLAGALNAELNDLERKRSREMADLSFGYQVALGDYTAAQEVVDQRIADMEADRANRVKAFEMAFNFAQDDMTESEKLQAQQAFSRQQDERNFEQQKEIAKYQNQLSMNLAAYNASLKADEEATTLSETDSLNQLAFLRDTAGNIIGTEDDPGLYKGAGVSGIGKFLGDKFVGDTKYRRLETQVDTLRANMLTLATDPTIKQFFGPQMSDADVRLMTAAGTTLRPGSQSPTELKAEAQRIDGLLNRMETAVRQGTATDALGGNVITAPDGAVIQIID